MQPVLRPARSEDLADLLAIYAPEVRRGTASWEWEPPELEEWGRRFAAQQALGWPWLPAELDGRIAGYAHASRYRPRIGYAWCVEDSVYVAEGARGRGVGRALLAALIAACTERGARQMVAVIGDSANTASIALHRASGFHEVGRLASIGFKAGRWLDSVLMQRALGAGASSPPALPPP
ncbi:MAG: GNAT family N-acetyltransferase [Geminicoccaceae bacterium]|nr:GNAT family N-acetyltransferase [Geminicoccaceae bacterium]